MASRFWLAAYIVRLFDYHFSLVYFSGIEYISARKVRHHAHQSVDNRPEPLGNFKLENKDSSITKQTFFIYNFFRIFFSTDTFHSV